MSLRLTSEAEGPAISLPDPHGRFLECDTDAYYADPCETPSLSQSTATELILRSPLHAWQHHPRLGKLRRESTGAMDDGTLTHALLLGKGLEDIKVLDVDSFRTNAAKAARDEAIAAGKTVVKASEYEAAIDVAKILRRRAADFGIALGTDNAEEKIEWTEETPEGSVLCRGMLDHVVFNSAGGMGATIIDLKTCVSAHPKALERKILAYGYDIQETAYRRAVQAVAPECTGRIDFLFLFAEIVPPYAVTPVDLSGAYRLQGGLKWERACRTWARCLKTNKWPGYVEKRITLSPPPWALNEEAVLNDDENV